ncbi:uncharacterized protein LOC110391571 isoform X3 [Numida meleagris]|uniref:uncharacterized protein LOC110391571 isoform X3 n=2 Tax=Numida meleagris TaxID=8996 RepID=UPI000B3DB853|nr:uncharacterized protein LOC110391571 isoform X3 [Numida meleagris]XP_021239189.1 uncharacterized protein LOC110391571 isoform X3 [Numida meleagris]
MFNAPLSLPAPLSLLPTLPSLRTARADLSSTIQHFHTVATGEQQSDMPRQEAMLCFQGEESQRENQWGCKWNVGRRKTTLLLFVSGVLVGVIVTLVPVIVLQRPSCSPRPQFSHVCPNAWVGFQGKCHYFSDTESDWNSSREHCQRLGASLATIDTVEERVRAGREPQCHHGGGKPTLVGPHQLLPLPPILPMPKPRGDAFVESSRLRRDSVPSSSPPSLHPPGAVLSRAAPGGGLCPHHYALIKLQCFTARWDLRCRGQGCSNWLQ